MIDPHEILFSLPTIADVLPPIAPGTTKLEKRVVELHEDDWRQVEFVSRRFQSEIDDELESIERIRRDNRVGPGFKKIHVRERIPAPLAEPIAVSDFRDSIGINATWLDGISFRDAAGMIAHGFAVKLLSSVEFYGQNRDGYIFVLAVQDHQTNNGGRAEVESIAKFCIKRDLWLLDWCTGTQIDPQGEAFRNFFAPAELL
ncbi:MAG TPA: hypothetical protein VHS31_01815 [Tepidisphaeraceae bacterium]|nr:hypothetical protein [Tepidisphaeraceae bacterium]